MKVKVMLSLVFICCGIALSAQELKLYGLQIFDKSERERIVFTSLSDSYVLSENPDSSAIPGIEGKEIYEVGYLNLEGEFRTRFLKGTGISESDQLFIYDYVADKLVSLAVKDLKVVACINVYAGNDDFPFHDYDYQIGFEIDKSKLSGFYNEDYSTALVFAGAKNPFEKGKMKALRWELCDETKLPSTIRHSLGNALIAEGYKNFERRNIYRSTSDGYQFFVQEISVRENDLRVEHLMVFDKNDELVCDKLYFEGEGSGLAQLNGVNIEIMGNYQWAGKLFKGKPPVVFGFEFYDFGCPEISFLQKDMEDFYINCDNRH